MYLQSHIGFTYLTLHMHHMIEFQLEKKNSNNIIGHGFVLFFFFPKVTTTQRQFEFQDKILKKYKNNIISLKILIYAYFLNDNLIFIIDAYLGTYNIIM